MKDNNIKITYPNSEKIYINGSIYPEVKVGMRKVTLTPSVSIINGKRVMIENQPIYIYDTSGPYSDPKSIIDLKKGLPRLRENG